MSIDIAPTNALISLDQPHLLAPIKTLIPVVQDKKACAAAALRAAHGDHRGDQDHRRALHAGLP